MRFILFAIFLYGFCFYLPLNAAPLPQIIHTCNFDQSIDLHERLENWKRVLAGFQIKVWDKSNFNLNENDFLKKALAANRYDLLSTYCAYKVLYNEGGVYLSPFWQANKEFSKDLLGDGFLSFMHNKMLSTSVMALPQKHPLLGQLLHYYQKDKRALGLVPPSYVLTDFVFTSYPTFQKNGLKQSFLNDITLYPATSFILNLGSYDNIGNYRFDYTPALYKTAEMSFGILKELYLQQHSIQVSYNNVLYHIFPKIGHTFTVYENKQHIPWGYIDEHTAALNWLGPTLLFTYDNGRYVYESNYVLAKQKHYGRAKEIKVQGNEDVKGVN